MIKRSFAVLAVLLCTVTSFSQKADTLIKKLDSLSLHKDSLGGKKNDVAPAAYNENTRIGFKEYFILLASDFKQEITKPFHMTKKEWVKVGIFAAATAALTTIDEPVQQVAVKWRNNNPALRSISSYVTKFGGRYEAYLLVGLGAYGFIFKNVKMQTTTLLATQSYLSSSLLSDILKRIAGRQRPVYTNPSTGEGEPVFYGPFRKPRDANGNKIDVLSFPSGHTIAAFSAATVYAMEYRNNPVIPILSYTAATIIGLSRITENKHWLSDVFAGAAVGYLSGRLVVNNYHRMAKLKAPGQKKNTVFFNLDYNHGMIMPGIVYRFG